MHFIFQNSDVSDFEDNSMQDFTLEQVSDNIILGIKYGSFLSIYKYPGQVSITNAYVH